MPVTTSESELQVESERLRKYLLALESLPSHEAEQLPGESAALAAYRANRTPAEAGKGHPPRIGARQDKTGYRRPMRHGIAAVVAVWTLGGVAMLGGTDVPPTPFEDGTRPAAGHPSPGRPEPSPSYADRPGPGPIRTAQGVVEDATLILGAVAGLGVGAGTFLSGMAAYNTWRDTRRVQSGNRGSLDSAGPPVPDPVDGDDPPNSSASAEGDGPPAPRRDGYL
ncbi:hypothetical protein AB0Q95_05610 [Streptomyces sp. NPDC059900]|uniref:hypothetical protein n=1 Tax=Streptomyces sp. NPDC059900 TaxID=3155816 RepID=UPI00342170B2